jgi:hypothetical protein
VRTSHPTVRKVSFLRQFHLPCFLGGKEGLNEHTFCGLDEYSLGPHLTHILRVGHPWFNTLFLLHSALPFNPSVLPYVCSIHNISAIYTLSGIISITIYAFHYVNLSNSLTQCYQHEYLGTCIYSVVYGYFTTLSVCGLHSVGR